MCDVRKVSSAITNHHQEPGPRYLYFIVCQAQAKRDKQANNPYPSLEPHQEATSSSTVYYSFIHAFLLPRSCGWYPFDHEQDVVLSKNVMSTRLVSGAGSVRDDDDAACLELCGEW